MAGMVHGLVVLMMIMVVVWSGEASIEAQKQHAVGQAGEQTVTRWYLMTKDFK